MADFPRTVTPDNVSPLWLPTGLRTRSHSGFIQIRNLTQVGWVWSEQFNFIKARNITHQEFIAYLTYAFNRQVIFQIKHLLTPGSGLSRNGLGNPAGNITVSGASQLGETLVTTGWPVSQTNVVRGGDVISVGNRVYRVRAAANSNGSGVCSIPVSPSIFFSPANGAVVTIEDVTFDAIIWSLPRWPMNTSPDYYAGTIEFAEVQP